MHDGFYRTAALALMLLLMALTGVPTAAQAALSENWSAYVIMGDQNSLYIRWKTAEPSRDSLTLYEEGGTDALGVFTEETALRFHSVLLADLFPGATLHYRTEGTSNAGMEGSLPVPREGGESTFLVMGDTQALPVPGIREGEMSKQKMLVDVMAGEKPPVDFLVHTGNLARSGAMAEYDGFFQMIGSMTGRMPLFAVKGNRDDRTGLFDDAFSFPLGGKLYGTEWHHFSTKNALFVFLNVNCNSMRQVSHTEIWLDAALEAFQDRKWKFVFTHQPFYGSAEGDWEPSLRDLFEPLLMKYGVDVVFSGHHLAYQLILRNGIVYIVSGGGGGPGYAISMNPDTGGIARAMERTVHYLRGQARGHTFLFEARRVSVEGPRGRWTASSFSNLRNPVI